jgi:hypothetical protein
MFFKKNEEVVVDEEAKSLFPGIGDCEFVVRRGRNNRPLMAAFKKLQGSKRKDEAMICDALGRPRRHNIDLDDAKMWNRRYLKRIEKQYALTQK